MIRCRAFLKVLIVQLGGFARLAAGFVLSESADSPGIAWRRPAIGRRPGLICEIVIRLGSLYSHRK